MDTVALPRADFETVRDTGRWDRAEPGNAYVNPGPESGTFAVKREGGDWHFSVLTAFYSDYYGVCDCPGFGYNSGPCSHLTAIYRLNGALHRETPRLGAVGILARMADIEAAPVSPVRLPGYIGGSEPAE